jgi:hypothetical protein
VVSPCTSFCYKAFTFWRSALSGSSWTRVHLDLPASTSADIAVHGETVYVVDPEGGYTGAVNKLYASTDGLHFKARPVPCDNSFLHIALLEAVATSATDVDLLCDGNGMPAADNKYVYRSTNTGKTDTYAGIMGLGGEQAEMAVSSSGKVAVASWAVPVDSLMYINDSHKTTWNMVIRKEDGGAGWNDIVYVTDSEAWVVYAPASLSGIGQLYVTRDGGNHWSVAAL